MCTYSSRKKVSLTSLRITLTSLWALRSLMIRLSLMTLISFRHPNSLNYWAMAGSRNIPAMESSGIVDRKSIVKLPFKYLIAIVF